MQEGGVRLFVAGELPDSVRDMLGRIQDHLRSRGLRPRWVRPSAIHLTLRFLGETDPPRADSLRPALRRSVAPSPPLTLRLAELGVFPGAGPPRVLWVGLAGDLERLAELAVAVEGAVVSCGWQPEKRPFRPHLTLARIDMGRAAKDLRRVLGMVPGANAALPAEPAEASVFTVTRLILFESRLGPEGSAYLPMDEFPLEGEHA